MYITAECLKKTGDDQDADGFRDCLYDITWSGALGNDYSFDDKGEVVGLSRAVVEILPTAQRTESNYGFNVLGPASNWNAEIDSAPVCRLKCPSLYNNLKSTNHNPRPSRFGAKPWQPYSFHP